MALNSRFTTDANNNVTGVTNKQNDIDAGFEEYLKRNPEPKRDYTQPAPTPTPTPAPTTPTIAPTSNTTVPTTGGTPAPATTPEETAPTWVMDAHFNQQYFLDEQKNRKNPNFVSEIPDVPDAAIDNIALVIKGRQTNHPDNWKYGDPGWRSDDALWSDYIKPLEDAYKEQERAKQIVQAQQATEDVANNALANNPRFAKSIVDDSEADYSGLSNSGKAISWLTPSYAGTDAKNMPGITKYTQNILGSWMSSGGTAKTAEMIASMAGSSKAGLISGIVKGLTAGYSYGKSIGKIKPIKPIDKIIELTDIADEKMQQAIGALYYGYEMAGGGDLADPTQAGNNIAFLVDNFGTIMHYAYGSEKASSKYPDEVVGAVTAMTSNMSGLPFIGDFASRTLRNALSAAFGDDEYIERNQTTRANLGMPGVYEIDEELLGSNAIPYWLELGNEIYNEGITNPEDIEREIQIRISRYYGDRSTFSEYLEHEFVDPGNTIENMDARIVGAYADITNDPNLKTAATANTGSLIGDLTGGIPIVPDVLRQLGRLAGDPNFLSTSGGLNEILHQWDIENITNDPELLTARDRRFSEISENDTINRFTPNENPSSKQNVLKRLGVTLKNFVSETNESRAAFEGDAIFTYINDGLDDAIAARGNEDVSTTMQRINKFVDELENPEKISEESPFYKSSKSVLWNSIKDDVAEAVRTRRGEINKHIERYFALDANRKALMKLSTALNMSPEQVLDKYENDKERLTQMIINKADANGGKIEGIDLDVESKAFGDEVIKMIAPFAGDDGEAWDLRLLGVQVSTSIADGVTDTLINKYGVKPDKLVYRFGDTIKKMQNLLLLGLSPSYLANNLVNNMVTRTALGYGGYMTPKTIGNWMKRFGYSPDRFADSISNEIGQSSQMKGSNYEKLSGKIIDKKKAKDFLEKVGSFSSKASKTLGVFGNLSNKVEASESQQIVAAAMMNYLSRTWKPGVNFRRMPADIERMIEQQCPGMVNTIYSAISSGINMTEIENALFGSFVAPSVEDTLKTAALRLGISEDVINEYFVKNGMLDQLQQSLHGKQDSEIDDVIAEFKKRLKALLSIQFDEEIARRAEAIGNAVTEEGFATAIEAAYDMADKMSEVWMNSMDANTRIFQRRVEEGIPTKEFRAMYQQHQKNLTERWENVYRQLEQTYVGILRGIGFTDKNNKQFLKQLKRKNDLWLKFYKTDQPAMIQPYLDALEWREGDTRATWDSRVKEEYKKYQDAVNKEMDRIYDEEAKIQKAMDKAYLAGLKQAVGTTRADEVESTIAPLLERINAKRAEMIAQTKVVREEANKVALYAQKNSAWLAAEKKRKDLVQEYTNLQHDLYAAIEAYKPIAKNKPVQDVTADVDHVDNIIADVTEKRANDSQKEAETRADIAADLIDDGADLNEVDARLKYLPESFKKLSKDVRDILTNSKKFATRKEMFDSAKQKLTNNTTEQFFRLQSEIEGDIDRPFTDNETTAFYWYVEGITGEKILQNEKREKMYKKYSGDYYTALENVLEKIERASKVEHQDYWTTADDITNNFYDELDALEKYTNMKSSYELTRSNLVDVAIRAGADNETADAFSKYFSLIADKWEKNHPGKDFFKNAPGMGITVFFKEEEYANVRGGKAAGTYDPATSTIDIFKNADFFVFVHEIAHGFQYTLDDSQINELAKYFGMTKEEYVRLRDMYYNPLAQTTIPSDIRKWRDCTELFVRGFLDYITSKPNEATTRGMRRIFESFRRFCSNLFADKKDWYKKHFLNHKEESNYFGNDRTGLRWGLADVEHNGTTLRKVFDMLIGIDNEQADLTPEQIMDQRTAAKEVLDTGFSAPLADIDLSSIEPSTSKGDAIAKLAGELYDVLKDAVYPKDDTNPNNIFTPPTIPELMQYIIQSVGEDGQPLLSETRRQNIDFLISTLGDPSWDETWQERIELLRNNRVNNHNTPNKGMYVERCYSFDHGKYTIVGIVYEDGKQVAYVPSSMDSWEIEDGDSKYRILGVSPDNPEQFVYIADGEIRTEQVRTETENNPHSGEMAKGTMPVPDPVGDAHNTFAYENVFNILDEFASLYKSGLLDNMSRFKFEKLDEKTREYVRGYINRDVRQDLQTTKYKTEKFGEMMRDAALLNYNKRYGFDNVLTLLCPYQFWMTRSVLNWINRMNTKGGKLWRKYYKLKELERKNKKEFMPSNISGKFGLYIPGLSNWMGDSILMSTDQLFVVNQFIDPLLDYGKDKNAVIAAAEKFLQEDFEAERISPDEYLEGINPETRENSSAWQAALAKAQLENDSDTGFGNLVEQYFGLNLPTSVIKALVTGDQSKWNQWPMTRTGTAFRAIVGDNWLGRAGELVLSAPEKAVRDAAVKTFGNSFAYNEFGAFGDYYLRNKVFDMVVEGKIDAPDAVQACIEKDGNPIWEEAADRQRQETLVKMQGGAVIDASKKLISDLRAGDAKQDNIKDDFMYLLAAFITAPMGKSIVSESERQWRKDKGELNKAYEAKANGDKDAVNSYYDEHEYATYNNLRYEADPDKMLRQFLYKNIMDNYYNLDTAERSQISMSFGPDFNKYVLDKDTRAIEAIDINQLAAYAQALNGKIPYVATDKLNTMNVQPAPIMPVPQTVLSEYNEYKRISETEYPGMAKANSIYYSLPAEDRKYLADNSPRLVAYQNWDRQYKVDHPNVKNYSSLISDSFDIREMENFCAQLDFQTMKYMKSIAYSDKLPDKEYKMVIESLMNRLGITDKYDTFVKNLKLYILGE